VNIFNELAYAEKLLINGFSKYMSPSDITILAKYYKRLEFKENEIEKKVFEFCEKFEPTYNEILHTERILRAIKRAKSFDLRLPQNVPITKNEILKIKEVGNYRYEKVLFTLLAVGKYYKITNTNKKKSISKDYYVNCSQNEILKLAHVIRKKDEGIFYELFRRGFIGENQKTSSIILKFTNIDDNSENEILIDDMDKIADFYPARCSTCGKIIQKNSNRHTLCENCWKEKNKEIQKKWIRNKRKSNVEV